MTRKRLRGVGKHGLQPDTEKNKGFLGLYSTGKEIRKIHKGGKTGKPDQLSGISQRSGGEEARESIRHKGSKWGSVRVLTLHVVITKRR